MAGSCSLIEISSPTPERMELLAKEYQIHPLAVEDCLNRNQRSKFEDFENHQFMVWHSITANEILEFQFVIRADVIIMIADRPPLQGPSWKEGLRISEEGKDAHHLLYHVLDRINDMSEKGIRAFYSDLGDFERRIFDEGIDPKKLLGLKHRVIQATQHVLNLPSVVTQWTEFSKPKTDLKWRLRDLWDHAERDLLSLQACQNQISAALDAYWGLSSKLVNEQVRRLTAIAAVFIPLTFWTGFFGMNFQVLPFNEWWFFAAGLIAMGLSVSLNYFILRNKGYW